MSNILDKLIIDAPDKEIEDAIRHKLEHHFDEQEALKRRLIEEEENE
jgi:hypothetical protein|tara:strand:- start:106 stop:246 length:141 start_codon:yes stop_codon:yes gene_type:complete